MKKLLLFLFLSQAGVAFAANSAADLANTLGKCSGSYKFASIIQDDSNTKNTLAGMSDLSLQFANALTKMPYSQLRGIRDNEISVLTNEFERVMQTKDRQRLMSFGNSIGQRNNRCTELIQRITDSTKK